MVLWWSSERSEHRAMSMYQGKALGLSGPLDGIGRLPVSEDRGPCQRSAVGKGEVSSGSFEPLVRGLTATPTATLPGCLGPATSYAL